MDNAQKAIMIGVGLFITIIIISAVMLITSAGSDMINNSTDQVGNISSSLQAQLTSQYDETILNGSQVIAAIKANYTTEGLILCVTNHNGKSSYYTSIKSNNWNGKTSVKDMTENKNITRIGKLTDASDTDTFVSSTDKYRAHLVKLKDTNTVVGLYFVELSQEKKSET